MTERADQRTASADASTPSAPSAPSAVSASPVAVDRTPKLYVGGKQARPDSGYSLPVIDWRGRQVAEVPAGNRKDIRNAVEAAHHAQPGWRAATAHLRAQVLYYLGENLAARAAEFAARISALTGADPAGAEAEVARAVECCFRYAAWADKWEGAVHHTPYRNVTIAMQEPVGVMAIVCPESPSLAGFLETVLPAVAVGNAVVAVPSQRWPLPATDCYQLLDTSDVPGGVINIVTGGREELAAVLAAHDDVDGIWYWGTAEGSGQVEKLSAGNMKRTWVDRGIGLHGTDEEFLRQATQVKNIWIPYGA